MVSVLTSLRTRLLVIVLLALAPAVVLLFVYAARQTELDEQRTRADILRVLEADQHTVQDLFDAARGTLVTFADSSAVRKGDWRAAEASARHTLAVYEDYLNVAVADASGRVLVSAVHASGTVDVSDRLFFQRAVRRKALSIGECQVGKLTRRPSMNLAYPLLDGQGRVKAVAYLAVDVEAIRRRLAPAGLPADAAESLLDSEGRVVLSVGRPRRSTGEVLDSRIARMVQGGEEGSATVTDVGGIRREYAVENVLDEPETRMYLALEFVPATLYADERAPLLWTTAGFALVALVAGASAWGLSTIWVYWPTRRMASAATRIGRGDFQARVRLRRRSDEIGTLGREFDSMAEALENRMAELQRTRRELAWANAELEDRVRRRTDELETANRIAGTLQHSLLSMPETIEDVEFGHFYRSATESSRVGGDFYDIFSLSEGRVAFLVGDVSGKGLDAASLTALVKNALRAYAVDGDPPEEAMRKANRLTHRFTATEIFVTALFGVLDTRKGLVTYATAGHPPPLVLGPDGVFAGPAKGPLLGAFAAVTYERLQLGLLPGSMLVAYTDGVVEARGRDGRFYGEKRLRRMLARLGDERPCDLALAVHEELRRFGDGRVSDDMAFLAIRADLGTAVPAEDAGCAG